MAQATTDWIEWTGGECPVEIGTRIQYRARSGFESGIYAVRAWEIGSGAWAHGVYPDPHTDIIAYRVVSA